ncbi:unnamed protein product [Closterium sp. NIES-65]|nr:unnamed protein product [Closterium sp. NIES-65]
MATPSVLAFDAEGRAIDFKVWVDDLQLFLQCDRADGLSLFDLTSGASPAPAADADATSLLLLLLLPTSLVSSRSALRLPLRGSAVQAGARGARALEELAGAVEVAVEAAEGVGVVEGVVEGVGVPVAPMGVKGGGGGGGSGGGGGGGGGSSGGGGSGGGGGGGGAGRG